MNDEAEVPWSYGQRIVDLGEVATQMQCRECSLQLDFNRTQSESRFGLASVLVIACRCGVLNNVHTSKRTKTEKGAIVYAVNAQITACIQKSGLGKEMLKKLLTWLHIPLADDRFSDIFCILADITQNDATLSSYSAEENNIFHDSSAEQHSTHSSHPPVAPANVSFTDQAVQETLPLQQQECGLVLNGSPLKYERFPDPISDLSELADLNWSGQHSEDGGTHSSSDDKPESLHRVGAGCTKKLTQCRQARSEQRHHRVRSGHKKKKKLLKRNVYSESPPIWSDRSVLNNLTDSDAFLDGLAANATNLLSQTQKRKRQQQDKTEHLLTVHFSSDAVTEYSGLETSNEKCAAEKLSTFEGEGSDKMSRKVCDVCGMYLSNRSALSRHRKLKHHLGEPLVCPMAGCSKQFARQELLESHISCIHSNDKPFQCSRCGKQFGSKKYMLDHMARCGRQPYKCDTCEMTFRDRAARRDHIAKRHKGQQFFACHCGKVYGWRTSLLKHQKKCHLS